MTDLETHIYRYRNHSMENILCSLWGNVIEDEIYCVLVCPFRGSLRIKFIDLK